MARLLQLVSIAVHGRLATAHAAAGGAVSGDRSHLRIVVLMTGSRFLSSLPIEKGSLCSTAVRWAHAFHDHAVAGWKAIARPFMQ
eukprot:361801-Chlamydomonas_euryale.AAC.8